MKKEILLVSRDQLDDIALDLREAVESGKHIITINKKVKKRTPTQNASFFKYYRIIAEKLNDAGFTARTFFYKLKAGFEVGIVMEDVRKVAEKVSMSMFNKEVKNLSTTEIQDVYLTVDKGFSISMGVTAAWPTDEPPMLRDADDS